MENDPGLRGMYQALRRYDVGVLRTVSARKALKIAALDASLAGSEPDRNKRLLRTYLDEDRIVYETVAYVLSLPEEGFEDAITEIGPAMRPAYTDIPRSVVDSYRRGLTDLELRMEQKAAEYADDVIGIVSGHCEYRRLAGPSSRRRSRSPPACGSWTSRCRRSPRRTAGRRRGP